MNGQATIPIVVAKHTAPVSLAIICGIAIWSPWPVGEQDMGNALDHFPLRSLPFKADFPVKKRNRSVIVDFAVSKSGNASGLARFDFHRITLPSISRPHAFQGPCISRTCSLNPHLARLTLPAQRRKSNKRHHHRRALSNRFSLGQDHRGIEVGDRKPLVCSSPTCPLRLCLAAAR